MFIPVNLLLVGLNLIVFNVCIKGDGQLTKPIFFKPDGLHTFYISNFNYLTANII